MYLSTSRAPTTLRVRESSIVGGGILCVWVVASRIIFLSRVRQDVK